MRALVVCGSMCGNTHAVAVSIAAGLSTRHDVTLVPVTRATPELAAAADLLVVGGPTHLLPRGHDGQGPRSPEAGKEDPARPRTALGY
jgi:flavodoxin